MNRPLPTQALSVKEIGSFHVGGRQVTLSGLGEEEISVSAGGTPRPGDAHADCGRAGWVRYREVFEAEPFFRTKKGAWELFRVGPIGSYVSDAAKRSAHAGQQFPVFAFDQFCKQTVPRWACNDAPAQAAYGALVEKVGPCVVIVHSQGGNFGFMAAHRAPDKVKALVAVEASGAPDPAGINMGGLGGAPHLFGWGDY